jgi:hypothetical protein
MAEMDTAASLMGDPDSAVADQAMSRYSRAQ